MAKTKIRHKCIMYSMRQYQYQVGAFVSGFVLMLYELCGSRVLTPVVGGSSYAWTGIIGVIIASLSGGYITGGILADRRAKSSDIGLLFALVVVGIFMTLLFIEPVSGFITRVNFDVRIEAVLASIVLFAPTSFLLGALSPYLAKLSVTSLSSTGTSIASLSALNSIGGILGTFLTGFVLFNLIGVRTTLVLGGLICVIMALWLGRLAFGRRIGLFVVLLCTVLATATPADRLVAAYDTSTASYTVQDIERGDRTVRVLTMGPGGYQSGIFLDNPTELAFAYTERTAEVIRELPQPSRILILGGGALSLPSSLARQYPSANIDVVELDSKLTAIAREHFFYADPPNVTIINQDARTFLRSSSDSRYDAIVVDVFSDSGIPFSVTTQEFTDELSSRLSDNGVVITNVIGSNSATCAPLLSSIAASYRDAFSWVEAAPLFEPTMTARQNVLLISGHKSPELALQSVTFQPIDSSNARTLTDDFAPIELLHNRCLAK
jgi:spermidine synthase